MTSKVKFGTAMSPQADVPDTLRDLGISVLVTVVNKRVSRQKLQSKTGECSRKCNKTDFLMWWNWKWTFGLLSVKVYALTQQRLSGHSCRSVVKTNECPWAWLKLNQTNLPKMIGQQSSSNMVRIWNSCGEERNNPTSRCPKLLAS